MLIFELSASARLGLDNPESTLERVTCQMTPSSVRLEAVAPARRSNAAYPNSAGTAACHHILRPGIHVPSALLRRPQPDVGLPARPEPVHLPPETHYTTLFSASAVTLNECCAPRTARAGSRKFGRMGLSKEQRIGILLGIDGLFFLVELSVGMLLLI